MLHSSANLKSNNLIHSMNFAAIISAEPGCIPVSLEKKWPIQKQNSNAFISPSTEVVQFLQSN